MTASARDSILPDVTAVYREIAGTEPDPATITRIRRIGRLLKLTETDSGWILLAVLAAHASSATTNLQAASTLAASLGVAAGDVTKTAETLREATDSAASTITAAIDRAKPVLAKAFDAVAEKARWSLVETQDNLTRAIETAGSNIGRSIASQVEAAESHAIVRFNSGTGDIITSIENAVTAAVASAAKDLQSSAADLRQGATTARNATIEEWRSKTLTAISQTIEQRVKIDATEAWLTALKIGTVAVVTVLMMIALIFYGTHRAIWRDGYKTGATAARLHHDQQNLRASWANTPDGKLAYQLYRAGSIPVLAECTAPGWQIGKKDTRCYPQTVGTQVYGWRIDP